MTCVVQQFHIAQGGGDKAMLSLEVPSLEFTAVYYRDVAIKSAVMAQQNRCRALQ